MMIIVCVHIPQRELFSKILFAHKAAHRYGSSVVGKASEIRRCEGQVLKKKFGPISIGKNIKNGIIFELAITPEAWKKRIKGFLKQGFKVVSFDEEATALYDVKVFANSRIGKKSAENIEVLYSWGEWHNRLIKLSCIDQKKVAVVGHPRIEICQDKFTSIYDDQINIIKKKYGRFLLINTNCTELDWSEEDFQKKLQKINDKKRLVGKDVWENIETMRKKQKVRRRTFKQQIDVSNLFLKMAKQNGAEDIEVVMRPKPSVMPIKLEQYAREQGFVGHVEKQFSVIPWIKSSSAVLHYGCSTAIESALQFKPSVMVGGNEDFVAEPVKEASIIVDSEQKAAEKLLASCLGQADQNEIDQKYKAVGSWHKNINKSSSDEILDDLEKRGLIDNPRVKKLLNSKIVHKQRTFINNNSMLSNYDLNNNSQNDFINKFKSLIGLSSKKKDIIFPISYNEVTQVVEKLDKIFAVKTSCKKIGPQIFLLERHDFGGN